MNDIFSDKGFGLNLGYGHLPIFGKDDDIVDIGTVGYIFIPAEWSPHKALFSVDIKLGIANHDFFGIYIVKHTNFGFALTPYSIGFFEMREITDRKVCQICEVMLDLRQISF